MTTTELVTDQLDLFVADIIDVAPKGDLTSMEFPIFAISSKPDREKFRYENQKTGNWLEVIPSVDGRATMHDKDLLIYAIGQIAEGLNRGRATSPRVRITAYDYLVTTQRGTDGKAYKQIGDTIARLRGTVFRTNITDKNGTKKSKGEVFGLIDYGAAVTDSNGRLDYVELVLSDQLYRAITNNQILTYNRAYFGLRSPYDRRLYEICRKHCGNQPLWDIGLEKLWRKFGSKSSLREFRRKIKEIVEKQSIPDYCIQYETAKSSGTIEKIVVMKDLDGVSRNESRAPEYDQIKA